MYRISQELHLTKPVQNMTVIIPLHYFPFSHLYFIYLYKNVFHQNLNTIYKSLTHKCIFFSIKPSKHSLYNTFLLLSYTILINPWLPSSSTLSTFPLLYYLLHCYKPQLLLQLQQNITTNGSDRSVTVSSPWTSVA